MTSTSDKRSRTAHGAAGRLNASDPEWEAWLRAWHTYPRDKSKRIAEVERLLSGKAEEVISRNV